MTLKTSRTQAKILGTRVDSTSKQRVLRIVRERIRQGKKFFIVTPNPEIVMAAQHDPMLKKILNSADIAAADGIGLAQAHNFLELPNPKSPFMRILALFVQGLGVGFLTIVDRQSLTKSLPIIPGRELFMDLVRLANKKGWRVYLFGGRRRVADKTKRILLDSLKSIDIRFSQGPELTSDARPISEEEERKEKEAVRDINGFKPHLLFVAFDAGKQEKWVYRWFKELDIGGAMVVGGTFDYISGMRKLPPKWIEERGLEWLWRLFSGSQKTKRVFTAFPAFPLKVFWYKLTSERLNNERANRV